MKRAKRILLVEDNAGDADFLKESLVALQPGTLIDTVGDGTQALDYLAGKQPYRGVELPDLVLLDLNLPKMDGREVLAAIKSDQRLRHIPVVVLTSSDSERDVSKSYELGANCYVTKRIGLAESLEAIRSIANFWLATVSLP